jgi:HK97 family phage portal protein
MLNRLLQPNREQRAAYVDSYGHISRIGNYVDAGVPVDTETTLSVPAIWRGVTMIADTVGTMSLDAYRNDVKLEPTPRLLERPNPLETRVETISAMAAAILLHGNYVAILGEPGASGYPESIYPVNPERVQIKLEAGEKVFYIENRRYTSNEIFHIKGFSMPGDFAGVGIIAAQRQGIGAAIAVMKYAAKYFAGGAMPSYAIKSSNPDLQEIEAQQLKHMWSQQYGGTSREPVVLNASTDIEPLTANANDSQLVEARGAATTDSANIVGVPGEALGAPNSSRTYSNIESRQLDFLRTSIMPITHRIEATFTDYLPRGQEAEFDYDSLLRADTLTRYQAHKIALESGFLTKDEVRELEGLPPLGTPLETMPEELTL